MKKRNLIEEKSILDYYKLGNCQEEYQIYAMPIPKIQPTSFKPVLISESEFSDYSWTLRHDCLTAITVISFFCIIRFIAPYHAVVRYEGNTVLPADCNFFH